MILEIIGSVVSVIILTVLINGVEAYHKNRNGISFKESMALTELPVITFEHNNKKLNFLLDSGSNASFINEPMLKELDYKMLKGSSEMVGVEGNKVNNRICLLNMNYGEKTFEVQLNINNMSEAFGFIKKESGVQIHGILGSLFFQKYKYILDFDSLKAYIK